MSPSAISARASPSSAARLRKARAVAMSPLAKATRPSAQRRRASSIGIESEAIGVASVVGPRKAVASLLIASLAIGCAAIAGPLVAAAARPAAHEHRLLDRRLLRRRRRLDVREERNDQNSGETAGDRGPRRTFHRMGSARPPLLHQAAPAREIVIEPIGILGFWSSAGVSRRFRRRAKCVERGVGRVVLCSSIHPCAAASRGHAKSGTDASAARLTSRQCSSRSSLRKPS